MKGRAKDEKIYSMFESGVPVVDIANMFETSRGHIYRCLNRQKTFEEWKDSDKVKSFLFRIISVAEWAARSNFPQIEKELRTLSADITKFLNVK